jgi:hypothetical protein
MSNTSPKITLENKYLRDDWSGLPDFNKLRELSKNPNEAEEAVEFLIAFIINQKHQQEEMRRRWFSSIAGAK